MGKEFQVDSLEDMCSLMCDNSLPRKRGKEQGNLPRREVLNVKPINLSSDDFEPPNEANWREETYKEMYKWITYSYETNDDFIFKTITDFCIEVAEYKISKRILEKAILEYMQNHPEEIAKDKARQEAE